MGYGVMVTQQILVLFSRFESVAQRKGCRWHLIFAEDWTMVLMVTQRDSGPVFQVRILVVQHEAFLMEREAFFMRGG